MAFLTRSHNHVLYEYAIMASRPLTLAPFAAAVHAPPRWVLNALTRLAVPRRYSEPLARRLSLARMLESETGMSLPRAFKLAGRILAEARPDGTWRHESDNGAIVLEVELPRFFSNYLARLSLARNHYGEKVRGRRTGRRGSAIERAKAYGFDLTLHDSALRRTGEQRLAMLNDTMGTLQRLRGALR